ncbi:MAG: extracellular solute-binding protein [Chloroflexota bacterium]
MSTLSTAAARPRLLASLLVIVFALAASGCGPSPASGTITLYSTVTQATVESVVAAYEAANPGVTVEVFRAPTGEVAARIAAELREGGLRADLLWLTDPLSMEPYARDGLLATDVPAGADAIDASDQTATSWGTRLLSMVIVTGVDADPAPADWWDLTDPGLVDAVAIPDPGFAGSAFGLLGYFADAPSYGMDFYQKLKDNGAVIVKSPDEVTTGVAEGRFKAGITLDFSVRSAAAKGSPVQLVWPASGAVTMPSPIAAVATSQSGATARSFMEYVLSREGQALIAASGWQPARAGVDGGPPIDGLQIRPDWATVFGRQDDLLAAFRAIYGE